MLFRGGATKIVRTLYGVVDHAAKGLPDFIMLPMLSAGDIPAIQCVVQPGLRFGRLAKSAGHLAYKRGGVTAVRPSFRDHGFDCPG